MNSCREPKPEMVNGSAESRPCSSRNKGRVQEGVVRKPQLSASCTRAAIISFKLMHS
jgi:hypothetical protein